MIVAAREGLVIVDLFCGAGGATEAAERALRSLLLKAKHFVAVNHWPRAIYTILEPYAVKRQPRRLEATA